MAKFRIILNLGGEGEILGAINMNSLIANRTPVDIIKARGLLVIHDILEPWPFVDNSVDEIFGNCLPSFAPDDRLFILQEAFRVLNPECKTRMHSKMLHPDVWKASMHDAGYKKIVFENYDHIRHAVGVKL